MAPLAVCALIAFRAGHAPGIRHEDRAGPAALRPDAGEGAGHRACIGDARRTIHRACENAFAGGVADRAADRDQIAYGSNHGGRNSAHHAAIDEDIVVAASAGMQCFDAPPVGGIGGRDRRARIDRHADIEIRMKRAGGRQNKDAVSVTAVTLLPL